MNSQLLREILQNASQETKDEAGRIAKEIVAAVYAEIPLNKGGDTSCALNSQSGSSQLGSTVPIAIVPTVCASTAAPESDPREAAIATKSANIIIRHLGLNHGNAHAETVIQAAINEATDALRKERDDWQRLMLFGGTPQIVLDFINGQQERIHETQDVEKDCATLRETVRALREALASAESALSNCYDIVEYPATPDCQAQVALSKARAALAIHGTGGVK